MLLLVAVIHVPAFGQNAPSAEGRLAGLFSSGGTVVRGTVTAASHGVLQIEAAKGDTYKIETGPNTFFRKDRQPIQFSDIHAGDMVLSGGQLDTKAKTLGAVFVAVVSAEQMQQLQQRQADFGKTWLAGTVTALDGTMITVALPDRKTQMISVDENTSFRRHHESIVLPDIKTGDHVYARGAVEKGVFTAKVLTVVDTPRAGDGSGPRSQK